MAAGRLLPIARGVCRSHTPAKTIRLQFDADRIHLPLAMRGALRRRDARQNAELVDAAIT
jgi:hypothetical protein